MPYARYVEFEAGEERSTEVYDAVAKTWTEGGTPPGLILHCAGYDDDGVWRGVDIWESPEDAEQFFNERLMPAILEATEGSPQPPPVQALYELHNLVQPS